MAETVDVGIRLALYLDLMLIFGLVSFVAYAVPASAKGNLPMLPRIIGFGALAGAALSGLSLVVVTAAMSGIPLKEIDAATVETVATATATGIAGVVRILALLLLATIAASTGGTRFACGAMIACGGVAVASLACLGHGAADDGMAGMLHIGADIIHLIAASVWLGALAGLSLMLFTPVIRFDAGHRQRSHKALADFATVGSVVVGLIVLTGAVNSWFLVGPGNALSLGTTGYGQLLLAKLGLFAAMLVLAASNRFRLTPALAAADDTGAAIRALRISLAFEVFCAVGVVALVAVLGTLAPPVSG